MAPEASAGAAELLRAAAEGGRAADIDCTGGPQRCRPADLGDHRRRLGSFRTHWWFNKPLGCSPIECARRGWANTGPDAVECMCCGSVLRIERRGDSWLANGEPVSAEGPAAAPAWSEVLSKAHGPFCPWRSHEVGVADPSKLSDSELAEAVEERAAGLRASLTRRPALAGASGGSEEEGRGSASALEALARAGWECGGRCREGTDLIRCAFCLRVLAVQSFSHWPVDAGGAGSEREEPGEPPAKAARRSEAPEGSAAGLEPPAPGLWAPASTRGSGTATLMEPYALHRFYCPVYSRADDDLGPLAVRIIHAHAAARRAAAGGGTARADAGAGGPEAGERGAGGVAEVAGAEGSAAARAEELLRALDAILPPA